MKHVKIAFLEGVSEDVGDEIADSVVTVTLPVDQWGGVILAAVHGADTIPAGSFPKKIEILNSLVEIAKAVDPVVREAVKRCAAKKVMEGAADGDQTH